MNGKMIVHLDNSSTTGHRLENVERQSRAAMAEGYGVAPVPEDGQEHLMSPGRGRRPLRPCPACSATPEQPQPT